MQFVDIVRVGNASCNIHIHIHIHINKTLHQYTKEFKCKLRWYENTILYCTVHMCVCVCVCVTPHSSLTHVYVLGMFRSLLEAVVDGELTASQEVSVGRGISATPPHLHTYA
jgi:hypothetical protein